jgi:hypothetical protein
MAVGIEQSAEILTIQREIVIPDLADVIAQLSTNPEIRAAILRVLTSEKIMTKKGMLSVLDPKSFIPGFEAENQLRRNAQLTKEELQALTVFLYDLEEPLPSIEARHQQWKAAHGLNATEKKPTSAA